MSSTNREFVELGIIAKPHGFRGAFLLRTQSGKDSALRYLKEVYLKPDPHEKHLLLNAQWMPKGWKVTLESLHSDTEIDPLRGAPLYAKRSDLNELATGEYYISDLVGLTARNEKGESLGTIQSVECSQHPAGQDIWRIQLNESESILGVPAVAHFIESVDLEKRQIRLKNTSELV